MYTRRRKYPVRTAGKQKYSIVRSSILDIVAGPFLRDGLNAQTRTYVTSSLTTIVMNNKTNAVYAPPIYKVKHLKFNISFPSTEIFDDIFQVRQVVFFLPENVPFDGSAELVDVNHQNLGQPGHVPRWFPSYRLLGTYNAHPEWIMMDRVLPIHETSSTSFNLSTRLSRNLNSGDQIVSVLYVYWKPHMQLQAAAPNLGVVLSWSYATRSN